MTMSTDLVVPNGLSQTPQIVQDQEGNSSSLLLGTGPSGRAAGFVGIVGPGGTDATATLALSTYAEVPPFDPNVQITATDQGDYSATLAFNLQVPGTQGNGPFNTVLQLLPNGGIQLPHLPQPVSAGTVDLVIDAAGNVSPQNSSVRFKEDVRPLRDDFSKVLLLEPKSFTYKGSGARGIGYTAEEVAAADLGELVAFDADGQPLGVHYKMISIYLLELLKDQQAALAEVRAEIATLKVSTRCH
jgi:hypothetical protein